MQLTKHTDFALRCLMYVGALPAGDTVTISEVSEKFFIPRNHLMKIVNQLSKLGYVESIRGSKGGIRLGLEASEINLAQVVTDFEARITPVNCEKPLCLMEGQCKLQRVFFEAHNAFFDVLKSYSLADLLQGSSSIQTLVLNEGN